MIRKQTKLKLHQETLRNLSKDPTQDNDNKVAGSHTCTPTACSPFSCTLAPC